MFEDIEFVIACGGKGTRNYPQSKGIGHKCLLPFGSKRLIDHILKQIFNAGGRNVTIVCSSEEVINSFKEALRPTPEIAAIMRQKGYLRIAEAIEETLLPEDARIQYVIQEKTLGTAHVLGLAHRISHDKHAVLIFPDDIYLPADENNNHLAKLLDAFMKNKKQVLATGIYQEDVSRYSIIHNGRMIEKPDKAWNHIAGFSPFAIPKESLDYMSSKIDDLEAGIYKPHMVGGEWVYTDGINEFLDLDGEKNGFSVRALLKDDCDQYVDMGILQTYEHGLLLSLFTQSKYKDDHIAFAKAFLEKQNQAF